MFFLHVHAHRVAGTVRCCYCCCQAVRAAAGSNCSFMSVEHSQWPRCNACCQLALQAARISASCQAGCLLFGMTEPFSSTQQVEHRVGLPCVPFSSTAAACNCGALGWRLNLFCRMRCVAEEAFGEVKVSAGASQWCECSNLLLGSRGAYDGMM